MSGTGDSIPPNASTDAQERAHALLEVKAQLPVSEPVTSLPDQERLQSIHDMAANRAMRKAYAIWWFALCAVQLGYMNVLMLAVGKGCLKYSDWLFHAYLAGTFGECLAIVWLITRYLFPQRGKAD